MPRVKTSVDARLRRHRRIRKKVTGTDGRPRLAVFRSLNHIYAQIVDDTKGSTLVAASTQDKGLRDKVTKVSKMEGSRLVGELIAERAKSTGVEQVVFDRGGYRYHGRIKALADAARGKGLQF